MRTRRYSFMDIFETGEEDKADELQLRKITIPVIQRDYAQGRIDPDVNRVRSRFLDSLYDAITSKPITLDFVYGDVDENGVLTPLDGQQRLTTLFLLHWYASRKESIPDEQCAFLRNFSYETRYSARDFCAELAGFRPDADCFSKNGRSLSTEIEDQAWFPLDWKKDPTIHSMLVMLDAINETFREVPNIWERLCGGAITFYFLSLRDMGLTDDLYIKMNSRGKPLTAFEHFKAELERQLRLVDEDVARRIVSEIDMEWTDLLWRYRSGGSRSAEDDVTDDEFLRYFKFVCDIICYQRGDSPTGKSDDPFDLLDRYFAAGNTDTMENILTLERYFNCWRDPDGYDSPTEFLESFMAREHEPGKIVIESRYNLDIFNDCLRHYGEKSGSSRQRLFPLNRMILLYAIICYLQNQDRVTNREFLRRIRIINNLIRNSEDEISDRADRNQIPSILQQTDAIMLEGRIRDDIEVNFNENQLDEEREKLSCLKEHPEDEVALFRLEDHPLLYGQIGILGLAHLDYADRFDSLYRCDWDKVDCALMAIGDYGQQERNGWRWQYGSSGMASAWEELFHKSSNNGFDRTRQILIQLLSSAEMFNEDLLEEIAGRYIADCEEGQRFPWRYYYIKYSSYRPGRYGKQSTLNIRYSDRRNEPYMMSALYAHWYWSPNMYIPFLKEADNEHLSRDHNGLRLVYDDRYIECTNDAYLVKRNADDSIMDTVVVPQTDDMKGGRVDKEDRVLLLRNYLTQNGYIS